MGLEGKGGGRRRGGEKKKKRGGEEGEKGREEGGEERGGGEGLDAAAHWVHKTANAPNRLTKSQQREDLRRLNGIISCPRSSWL